MKKTIRFTKTTSRLALAIFVVMCVLLGLAVSKESAPIPSSPTIQLYPADPWSPEEAVAPERIQQMMSASPAIVISNTNWTFIGPGPLASGGSTGNVSGRITGIATDPTNANIIYIAAAGGGVWKSTDGGTTWNAQTDSQTTLSMGAIAIAPSNSSVIYAGTGEANNSLDSNFGRGILVSTDAGVTWTLRTGSSNRVSYSLR